MKKILSAILAVTLVFSQQYAVNAETSELSSSDQKIIEQVMDQNGDTVKDETDLVDVKYLDLDLTDIDDISILKKAVSLRFLSIKNGTLTDFSVLSELPSLYSVEISSNPVSDISFIRNSGIKILRLEDTNVTDEDKLKYIVSEDLNLPANHLSSLNVFPRGLVECEIQIKNPEIIAFGEYGDSDKSDNGGIVRAKEAGVTEYDILVDGKVVKTGKITVTEADTYDPPLYEGIMKIKSIKSEWLAGRSSTCICIMTEDGALYAYDGKEYEILDKNVKEYTSLSSSNGDPFYVLHNDGTMTIDGKNVFDDDTKVKIMDCSYSSSYLITEEDSLWYLTYSNGRVYKRKISDDVVFFDRRTEIYSTSDSTCFQIISGSSRSLGKHELIDVYQASYRENYLLDKDGTLWLSDKSSSTAISKFDTDVTKIGYFCGTKPYAIDDVYEKKDGQFYVIPDKKLLSSTEGGTLITTEEYYSKGESQKRSVTFYGGDYKNPPQLFKDERMDSDFDHYFSSSSEDKTEYFSFGNHFASVSNVELTSNNTQNDGNDYIILFVRTDGSLWEYHAGEGKFIRKDFGNSSESPEVKYTSSDIVELVRYLNGISEKSLDKSDINGDGTVNIIDLIMLKEILIS